jgi:hypothetical protein
MTKKNPVGRPTEYNSEIAKRICDLVATNPRGLKYVCESYNDMPHRSTVIEWRWKHPEFADMYIEAARFAAQLLGEETIEDARELRFYTDQNGVEKVDPGFTRAQELLVNTKKWYSARLVPRLFGDKIQLENTQKENEELKEQVIKLREELESKHRKEY